MDQRGFGRQVAGIDSAADVGGTPARCSPLATSSSLRSGSPAQVGGNVVGAGPNALELGYVRDVARGQVTAHMASSACSAPPPVRGPSSAVARRGRGGPGRGARHSGVGAARPGEVEVAAGGCHSPPPGVRGPAVENGVVMIETERLRLRGWRADDLDALAAVNADPEVMRSILDGSVRDRQQSAEARAGRPGHHGSDLDRRRRCGRRPPGACGGAAAAARWCRVWVT